MAFIIIYTTHKNMAAAKKMATVLLRKKLIACANFFPINSAYWWHDKLVQTKEVVALLKTQTRLWPKVQSTILAIHPYTTPDITKIPVTANRSYEDWVKRSTNRV